MKPFARERFDLQAIDFIESAFSQFTPYAVVRAAKHFGGHNETPLKGDF